MTDPTDDKAPWPWTIDGAHAGWKASDAMRVQIEGGKVDIDLLPSMDRDEMREYLASAPRTVDWKAGYAAELTVIRQALPGPQDELAKACRWIVRELGNKYPEVSLGAWEETGLPLALHTGIGRSETWELVARSQGKHFLAYFDAHPEDAWRPVRHMQYRFRPEQMLEPPMERNGWEPTRREWMCTGFQVGWALNAAKYVHGQSPVPNPAIIDEDDDTEAPVTHTLPSGALAIVDDPNPRGRHD